MIECSELQGRDLDVAAIAGGTVEPLRQENTKKVVLVYAED